MARKKSRRRASGVTRKRSPELQAKLRKRPAPGATAPDSAIPTANVDAAEQADEQELELSRGSALPSMLKDRRRVQWGLPREANKPGPYMVELNLRHPEGLDGAGAAFRDELFPAVMGEDAAQP